MKVLPSILIDFYKSGHIFQYPKDTTLVYTNNCPRSGHHFPVKGVDKVLFVGLQGIIKWLLIDTWNEGFFQRPVDEVIEEYQAIMDKALGAGAVTTSHIRALHALGYLPLRIKALPEGSLVPFKVPTLTIVNTHPDFFWVTNYFEDMLSCESWPVMTVATLAYYFRKMLEEFAEATGVDKRFCDWQGHDFAFRGMRGIHDATQSLSGHLYSFLGTDTIPCIPYLEEYYSGKDTFIGGSVPATEHSVMTMLVANQMRKVPSTGNYDTDWREAERVAFRQLITETYPSGIVSIVSDTKNLWDVLTDIAPSLREEILARPVNAMGMAKVVFRPDSGNPLDILCGGMIYELDDDSYPEMDLEYAKTLALEIISENVADAAGHGECGDTSGEALFSFKGEYYKTTTSHEWNRHDKTYYYLERNKLESFEKVELTPAQKGAVRCLWEYFGGEVNAAGYKVLNERVGLIYGDSITHDLGRNILQRLKDMGFASSAVVFGRGSFGSVYNTRDSTGSAMKATYGEVDFLPHELFKDPITDSGSKRSAKGLLRVEEEGGTFVLHDQQTWEQEASGALKTVFEDGAQFNLTTLAEVRNRIGFIVTL